MNDTQLTLPHLKLVENFSGLRKGNSMWFIQVLKSEMSECKLNVDVKLSRKIVPTFKSKLFMQQMSYE